MIKTSRTIHLAIASPGDVRKERDAVERTVLDWNQQHSRQLGITFVSYRWERAAARQGAPGQEIIHEDLIDEADALIAVFWKTVGTRAGDDPSGTISEIRRVAQAGKPHAIFHKTANIEYSIATEKLEEVRSYIASIHSPNSIEPGLTQSFRTTADLKDHVQRFLNQTAYRVRNAETDDTNQAGVPKEIDQAACISISPGSIHGNGDIHINVVNQGRAAAHDVGVVFDLGHGFPGFDSQRGRTLPPFSSGLTPVSLKAQFKVDPPSKDASGNPLPNQSRTVWCRVRYRDELLGWHNSYFLLKLDNRGVEWKVTEDTAHANVPEICQHTRPDAPMRESDEFTPAIPAVDPQDELLIDALGRHFVQDPDATVSRFDLAREAELGGRSEHSVTRGLERLERRGLVRIGQRFDDGPASARLTEDGAERALRRKYSNFDTMINEVLRAVCSYCQQRTDETHVQEIADKLAFPFSVVELVSRLLHGQKKVRRRPYADVVKLDLPDPRVCEELLYSPLGDEQGQVS